MATLEEARAAKPVLQHMLAAVDGVCGVGLACRGGARDWVLQVNVASARARPDVPAVVKGVPVSVRVVGAVDVAPAR
jgi:hypothetical protein